MHIQSGLTPLHLAAQEDKVNVAEVLLNHGADVNPQTKVKLSQMVYTHTDYLHALTLLHMLIFVFFSVFRCMYQCVHGIGKILSDTLLGAHTHTHLESSQVLHK